MSDDAGLRQRKPAGGAAEGGKTDESLKTVTMDDLKAHNTKEDPWLLIGGRVFGVGSYLENHPGGEEVMLEHAGSDATQDFKNVGHGENARKEMRKFLVGKMEGQQLLTDEELGGGGGGGNAGIVIFILLALIAAYVFYTQKVAKASA